VTGQRARRSARASYGAGSIEFRNDRWWIARESTINGQRRRWRDGPYETRVEATAHQAVVRPLTSSQATTIEAWLQRWSQAEQADCRLNARESYADIIEGHVRRYLIPTLGHHRLGDLRPSDCDAAWRNLLLGGGVNCKPLSRKTVSEARNHFCRSLEVAVKDDIIQRNVARLSALPKQHGATASKRPPKALSVNDAVTLIECLLANLDVPWAAPTLLAIDCGARRGEILGLGALLMPVDLACHNHGL
jgi:integrase